MDYENIQYKPGEHKSINDLFIDSAMRILTIVIECSWKDKQIIRNPGCWMCNISQNYRKWVCQMDRLCTWVCLWRSAWSWIHEPWLLRSLRIHFPAPTHEASPPNPSHYEPQPAACAPAPQLTVLLHPYSVEKNTRERCYKYNALQVTWVYPWRTFSLILWFFSVFYFFLNPQILLNSQISGK